MKIGFIGIGAMGGPMAKNLIRAGHELVVCSRSGRGLEAFSVLGAATSVNLLDAANAEAVFLCLTDSKAILSVCLEQGLLEQMTPGAALIDFGTTRYDATLRLADACAAYGLPFLDAPISGLPQRAENGTLTIMCGGAQETFDAMLPLLRCMGEKVLRMGEVGCGQLTKLMNQLLYNINMAAVAEIMPMAASIGLDPTLLTEVINSGTGRSHASEFFLPRILKGCFEGGLPMETAYKDMVSAAELAASHRFVLPVLEAATGTYRAALRCGYGECGKGAMIRVYEELLGVKFRAEADCSFADKSSRSQTL